MAGTAYSLSGRSTGERGRVYESLDLTENTELRPTLDVSTLLDRKLFGVERRRRGSADEGLDEDRLPLVPDDSDEPLLLSMLSRASTCSSLRYGSGCGLNMSSPEKRDLLGEETFSAEDRDAPLDRRELPWSELVLDRWRSCLAFRATNPGRMGDVAVAISPSFTGGSMIESTLPLPLLRSATRPGLELALGSSSSENRTLLERLLLSGLANPEPEADPGADAIDAASPLSVIASDVSEEMEERRIGRGLKLGFSEYDWPSAQTGVARCTNFARR